MNKGMNKGEWAEFYAFAQCVCFGQVNEVSGGGYYLIESVRRKDGKGGSARVYTPRDPNGYITIDGIRCGVAGFPKLVSQLYQEAAIKKRSGSFICKAGVQLIRILGIHHPKAGSGQKTDMELVLSLNGERLPKDGFLPYSVKSDWGAKPSVLNASKTGKMRFIIEGCGYVPPLVGKKLFRYIYANGGRVVFDKTLCDTWRRNLGRDGEAVLSEVLIKYYTMKGGDLRKILDELITDGNTQFNMAELVNHTTTLLERCVMGMTPGKCFNVVGRGATAGLLHVEGSQLSIRGVMDGSLFKEKLLDSAVLDTPSTSRHQCLRPYRKNGEIYVDIVPLIKLKPNCSEEEGE